ncbi:MAG: DEAD/DEAH box helicase family protein [Anaeromyxobacter sp.]|nr:DEAD/DEAH box helicase family protein [Anaeromyxobacter sp.]
MPTAQFSPGSLIRARGREWIVLVGSDADTLKVRPISGSEEDQAFIYVPLEVEPVTDATFPRPTAAQQGGQDSALLLRDALLLSLRRGAGPFRSFGQISVQPRAYQLVPLMMALKQDPVRLLIADDVGVGKTIEGALIARELIDRGEIERLAVLCPPHLVEQWIAELENRFNIRAAAVTASSATRLEKGLPLGDSIFRAHPYTVVSLDYIKSERRRDEFLRACPEFVIVDEAHTCASTGAGRHQRYELLKGLTADRSRHLVMLTATPHSGDEDAFYALLGLLDPKYERLKDASAPDRDKLREQLSRNFVQRRRPDIAEWKDGSLFPRRDVKQITYQLTGAWDGFFEDVLDYCAAIVEAAGGDERRQRLNFWGTLALMRCVASSPAAAAQALRTRAGLNVETIEETLQDRLFDGSSDALNDDDVEPPAATEDKALAGLIAQAEKLAGQAGDPKLKLLTDHLKQLVADGFSPVVFCRYLATAHYLGRHLREHFDGVTVDVVTGELTSDERKERVELLGDAEKRLLIATDCLSEGVNLQEHFDAVVHYDLSWNPTRHEQREGRVDRFGQESKVVRATLIYGANNPVDGAVLDVILRKAEKIREELGVPVPLPDEGHTLTQALMKAVLLRHGSEAKQRVLDFSSTPEAKAIDDKWTDAAVKARANRTVFAQRRLKPDDVLPEWKKTLAAMGGEEDVKRFTDRALARLGSGLEELKRGAYKAALAALPEDVRERLEAEGLSGSPLISFGYPPKPRCRPVQRSHPLVSVWPSRCSSARSPTPRRPRERDPGVLGRVGCWISGAVTERTTVAILRLRHQLTAQKGKTTSTLLVEEAAAIGWAGTTVPKLMEGLDALALLSPAAAADPLPAVAARTVAQALELLASKTAELNAFAHRRAEALLADHRRVREAGEATGKYTVKALLPADVIGLYVLLPKVS